MIAFDRMTTAEYRAYLESLASGQEAEPEGKPGVMPASHTALCKGADAAIETIEAYLTLPKMQNGGERAEFESYMKRGIK